MGWTNETLFDDDGGPPPVHRCTVCGQQVASGEAWCAPCRAARNEAVATARTARLQAWEAMSSQRPAAGLVVCYPGHDLHGHPCPPQAKVQEYGLGRLWASWPQDGRIEEVIVVAASAFDAAENLAYEELG